jgi:ComF family protein
MQCCAGDYCRSCGTDAGSYASLNGNCAHCHQQQIHFEGIARGGVYDGVLRDMILGFKFNDRTELAPLLCDITEAALSGSGFAEKIDFFVPVPLHFRRRFQRGYNQALLLSKGLKHDRQMTNTDLVRIRFTERQANLSIKKRKKNVEGAFAVRKGHKFSGRNVCLVDDITTTRSTLNECAKTLKQAGAKKVYALVTAVAMQSIDI